MQTRRVVITGLGVITSLSESVDVMWEALLAGKSGIKMITRFDTTSFPVRFGGECTDFDITRYGLDRREAKRMDRFGHFGLAASVNAVKDSGIDFAKEDSYRCGVLIGSGIGGLETLEEENTVMLQRGGVGNLGQVDPPDATCANVGEPWASSGARWLAGLPSSRVSRISASTPTLSRR